jgi:hypothetical protein
MVIRKAIVLTVVCVLVTLGFSAAASSASRPPSGAAKVVRAWIAAWSRRNWTAACRLESHSYVKKGEGGGMRGCIRGYRYLYAPSRPKEALAWLDRFHAGYRIIRTRARFIPAEKCQAYVSPGVCADPDLPPAEWAFHLFIHFRDGTYGCFGSSVSRERAAYRLEFPLSLNWSTTDLKSLPPHIRCDQ